MTSGNPWRPNDYIARLPVVREPAPRPFLRDLLRRAGQHALVVLEGDQEPTASIVMGGIVVIIALALVVTALVFHAPPPTPH